MKQNKKEKIEYKVFAMRLNEETKKKLKDKRAKSGLSWNLFIMSLLEKIK